MNTKRIILEADEKEFVDNVVEFAKKNEWTITNIKETIEKVVSVMEDNAVINE